MRLNQTKRFTALVLAFCLPGCAYVSNFFSDSPGGPGEVNDLNSSIERVYVDAELARSTVQDAVAALEGIAGGELGEDPAATYGAFIERLEQSEQQAEQLRDAIDPMDDNAKQVFKQWAANLREFTSPSLLKRSEARMEATKERYESVRDSAEEAHEALVAVNKAMRDHALFLGHDLNAESLEAVKDEVSEVARDAGELDGALERCMQSAQSYVSASAVKPSEPAPATVANDDEGEKPAKVEKVSDTQYEK